LGLNYKFKKMARHQWFISLIPATQEAEIRRIEFQSQPGQTVPETLSQKTLHKKKRKKRKGLVEWLRW
jgi:hypothetical protein